LAEFSKPELEAARKTILSSIRKIEKAYETLSKKQPPPKSQLTLATQNLNALRLASTLILREIEKDHFHITPDEVLGFYNWLKENGIAVWIDGGWGVDALLGKQTREHADLDIAVCRKDNAMLRRLLENSGYKEEMRSDSSEFMYVMKNEAGSSVDIHAFELPIRYTK